MEEDLPDGTRQSFDLSLSILTPGNNTFQVTDEFEVERPNGKFARPDIVVLVNGIPLVVIECKKSSVDVMEGVNQISATGRRIYPTPIPLHAIGAGHESGQGSVRYLRYSCKVLCILA